MSSLSGYTSDVKQVKVDNWGIYFLQRLKHFFNRTDYCDLTLQFQDNAQLKVHRLVLSACTQYFELLERTCEMYDDFLVMPDDLQADVVVPIINFMYTGQLEFKIELLEKLYQTSQVMNMPILTKLLDAHRKSSSKVISHNYMNSPVRRYSKSSENANPVKQFSNSASSGKRSYGNAFTNKSLSKERTGSFFTKPDHSINEKPLCQPLSPITFEVPLSGSAKKPRLGEPRPTRYELPEELDQEDLFENSFTSISYTSTPLMVHPESTKQYIKKSVYFNEASSSKKLGSRSSLDIIDSKRMNHNDSLFEDNLSEDPEVFPTSSKVSSSQLFDQIIENTESSKVIIESKDKQTHNLDHAKIISEVLKKYPHLVKTNKNIKLKILNSPNKNKKIQKSPSPQSSDIQPSKVTETKDPGFTYESDVMDSKEAARLIAMGAENVKGPWICLICGTPGKALHFTTYYNFRRHLVEVHDEKTVPNICEYCGLKSLKRNYMLHHLYTKHGVVPPPQYHFPKCSVCNYIALTEAFLVKHKMTHTGLRHFQCNACPAQFETSKDLLTHIQKTGHKYSAARKSNLQCIYCMKLFLREKNLYAHLKTSHKQEAKGDGIIEDSDDEGIPAERENKVKIELQQEMSRNSGVKHEVPCDNDYEEMDMQYEIHPDGKIQLTTNKKGSSLKQKILNPGYSKPVTPQKSKTKTVQNVSNKHCDFLQESSMSPVSNDQNEEIVMIDNNEYVVRDNQLIPRNPKEEFIVSDMMDSTIEDGNVPSTSVEYATISSNIEEFDTTKLLMKKHKNQPIQIVVSNEEEYKALMSSNHHSIIFDDNESNKTLTVLTAPHDPTLNTATMDIDNGHSNDMMIMQDDYQMNVTEAVSTGNSNIVVVYSHPVDSQKGYILDHQELGPQFVQSSAILTQNYETVSTSTPVMSAHVIDTQDESGWQNNEQAQISIVQPTTEIQALNVIEHGPIVEEEQLPETNHVVENLEELPPVDIISTNDILTTPIIEPQEIQASEVVNNTDANNDESVVQHVNEVALEEVIPDVTTMEVDVSGAIITENTENEANLEHQIAQHDNEIMAEELPAAITMENNVQSNVEKEQIPEEIADISNVEENITEHIDNNDEETANVEETIENIEQHIENTRGPIESTVEQTDHIEEEEVNSIEENAVENVRMEESVVDIPNENNIETPDVTEGLTTTEEEIEKNITEDNVTVEEVPVTQTQNGIENCVETTETKTTIEPVQNLVSEWSEDEDVEDQSNAENKEANNLVEDTSEMEESIENIQEEMKKQMINAGENHKSKDQSPEPAEVSVVSATTNNIETQHKISSLLNDWEDNDSQEEDNSVGEKEETQVSSDNNSQDLPETTKENVLPPKDDKLTENNDPIKSLVSDWDDEDDDK